MNRRPRCPRCPAARLLAALLAAGLAGPAAAQPLVRVDGVVARSAPAGSRPGSRAGTRVELLALHGSATATALTDAHGAFHFEAVAPGDYQLEASGPGAEGALRFITVAPDGDYTCRVVLASHSEALLLTVFWSALALLIAVAACATILLYGLSRRHSETSAPRSVTVAVGLWAAAFALYAVLAPDMQPLLLEVAAPLSSLLAALVGACVVLVMVELRLPPLAAALGCLSGLLLAVASRAALPPGTPMWLGIGVGLLFWTTAAGTLIAVPLKRKSFVVLAAILVAMVDAWSVTCGPTGALVQSHAPAAVRLASLGVLPWPVLGSDLVNGVIGSGDFLFLAWFLAAAQRFDMGVVRNFWALLAALSTGIILAHVMQHTGVVAVGLPALPFLCVFFLAANAGQFELLPRERKQIAGCAAGVGLVLAGLSWWTLTRQPVEQVDVRLDAPAGRARAARLWDPEAPAVAPLGPPDAHGVRSAGCTADVDGRPCPVTGFLAAPSGARAAVVELVPPDSYAAAAAGWWAARGKACLAIAGPAAGREPYDVFPRVHGSSLYAAGAAALAGMQVLRGQAGLVPVALVGTGWGGVAALDLAADCPDVAAVVAAGAGDPAEGDGAVARGLAAESAATRERWLARYGPAGRAAGLQRPVLLVAAANDPDATLPSVVALRRALDGGGTRLVILPNADRTEPSGRPAAAQWLDQALRGAAGAIPEPGLEAAADGARLRLTATGCSAANTASATFYLSCFPEPRGGWAGRWWSALPGRVESGRWTALAELAGSLDRIAAFVEVRGRDGARVCSLPLVAGAADLGLQPTAAVWPNPVIAAFEQGDEGWRGGVPGAAAPRGGALEVSVPPDRGGVRLTTNRVGALPELGGQAATLDLTLRADDRIRIEAWIVERFGTVVERRFEAQGEVSAGARQTVRLRLDQFHMADRSARLVWQAVDTLELGLTRAGAEYVVGLEPGSPGPKLRLERIALAGPGYGAVRAVETR
ncbi:MAG: carboxypeptidase regulatory-like domain-containing protein [Armatimonadetes bacterium]|nr:carboxypeptidase regulatory-like domain-containing protein [Armatimonadota bacterium]